MVTGSQETEIMRVASYAVLDFIRQHGRRPTDDEEQQIVDAVTLAATPAASMGGVQ